jgi:hypothetical protein
MGTGKSMSAIMGAIESGVEKILIVCPASLKLNWKKEIEFCDRKSKINIIDGSKWLTGAKWTIVNYDILKNFHSIRDKRKKEQELITHIIDEKFGLIISDECFVYDTLVTTNSGQRKIGDIVENKLNIEILSYNLKTNKLEYKPINRHIKKETAATLLRIKLDNGLFIDCTPNHKIYIKNKGYVRADQIRKKHQLFVLSETINQEATNKEKQILLQEMCKQNVYNPPRNKEANIRTSKCKTNKKNLYSMWKGICNDTIKSYSILWKKLFCKMDNDQYRQKMGVS